MFMSSCVGLGGAHTLDPLFCGPRDASCRCACPAQVMSKYGALWQHMFRLRRVQLALEGAWATLQVRSTPGCCLACLAAEPLGPSACAACHHFPQCG